MALAADLVSLPAKQARSAGYPPVGCSFDKSGSGLSNVVQFPAADEILRVQGTEDVPRVTVRTFRDLDTPAAVLEDTVRTLYSYPSSQPLVILGRPDVKLGSAMQPGIEYTTGAGSAKLHMLAAILSIGDEVPYGLIVEFTVKATDHPQ
ncbi:MAG: hypothetical protein ACYCW6_31580, partial [Candidatus Xenobia bacterium]